MQQQLDMPNWLAAGDDDVALINAGRGDRAFSVHSLAPRRPWPGTIRRVNDSLGLAHVGGQGKADRLEYTADISGHRRAHDEVFAVLLQLNILKPIEIHQ